MIGRGIAASRGKALARAMAAETQQQIDLEKKSKENLLHSVERVKEAIDSIAEEMKDEETRLEGEEEAMRLEIVQMQHTMLSDAVFHDSIRKELEEGYAPESAVARCIEAQCRMLEAIGDAYLAARTDDFRDVGNRIICRLLGKRYPDLGKLEEDVILTGENISPSVLAGAKKGKVKGLLLAKGSRTAHVCILAANMGIPAVVGCIGAEKIKDGDMVFVDGTAGKAAWEMDEAARADALAETVSYQEKQKILEKYTEKKGQTKDKVSVQIMANIMDAQAAEQAKQMGAEGVGLFRTEFLYMGRKDLPGEEEQFQAYKKAAEMLQGQPLVIRTMDIGGDKQSEALEIPAEENPFLGYRAIRICLERKELFFTQLKAVLRASAYGNVRVMFPMISSMAELEEALACLQKAKDELDQQRIAYDKDIQTGMMVEVPSTAILASRFIKKVDFFSIGSNDLTQYALAVDRQNEKVCGLYDYFDPGVLHLIYTVIRACEQENKECCLCGEMASDPLAVPVLLGMGLKKFSVNPSAVPLVKYILSKCEYKKIKHDVQCMLEMDDRRQIKEEAMALLDEEYRSWL